MIFYGQLKLNGISCFLGEDNEGIATSEVKVTDQYGNEIPRAMIRYIPSNVKERPPTTVEEFLKRIATRVGGNSDQIYKAILVSGADPSRKLTQADVSELAVLYVSTLFLGDVRLALIGDLLSKVDDPLKLFVMKQVYKILKKVGSDSLVFMSSFKYIGICDKIFVGAKGEVMEESEGSKEFYHPYSKVLMDSVIGIGKRGERASVRYPVTFSEVGCAFHDSCELSKTDRRLRRKCILERPKTFRVGENRVKCWYFEGK